MPFTAFVNPVFPINRHFFGLQRHLSSSIRGFRRSIRACASAPTTPTFTQAPVVSPQPELLSNLPAFRGRTGVLLVNIGTPASLSIPDVREYLRQFLGDRRVIDLNPFIKWLVLNLFILRTRPRESAEAYAAIWDPARGSPLLFHSRDLAKKLSFLLGDRFDVEIGMQYCEPSVRSAIESLRDRGADRIVVVPMYPQYASSATGAAMEIVYKEAARIYATPYVHAVPAFYEHRAYIEAYAAIIRRVIGQGCTDFDHLLMSFHGVPQGHCEKTDDTGQLCNKQENCCAQIVQANRNCYRAQSFSTARLLAKELALPPGRFSIAFQSRLSAAGPVWIKPYTDLRLAELAKQGVRRLAVVVPSFTADCLETLEEIGVRGVEQFQEAGGEELKLIPCLNSDDIWAKALIDIMKDSCPLGTF